MSVVNTIYNTVFRRTSTFAFACMVGAFGFERAFDLASETMFENMNRGKLWKHICHKHQPAEEEGGAEAPEEPEAPAEPAAEEK